jgi:pimeloyl-ACP methyl ester carboxylesterase
MAFAVYRATIDFARPTSSGGYKSGSCITSIPAGTEIVGASVTDDQSACRTVTIAIRQTNGFNFTTGPSQGININLPVFILRPPVVLIHGLWADPSDWKNFSPVYSSITGMDSRFGIQLAAYNDEPAGPILSSTPDYSSLPGGKGRDILLNARANSLGFQYNASNVLKQMIQMVGDFKQGQNPVNVVVAAVQSDVVAHSMGGNIARIMPLITSPVSIIELNTVDFFTNTFEQGSIHKLITIDTPHRGSVLATQLLSSQNRCVADILAVKGKPAFASVQLKFGDLIAPLHGAVGDLVDSPLSQALQNIAAPGQKSLPTAFIAGTANSNNLFGLDSDKVSIALHTTCGTLARNPLAMNLTSTGWPSVFANEANDAIVSLSSQLNGLTIPDENSLFDGRLHSTGIKKLGFIGPVVLDSGPIPTQVINLLNTPVSQPIFHLLNP